MAKFTGATLGFLGSGEIVPRVAKALLRDQIDAWKDKGGVRFVLPLTDKHLSDSLGLVVDFALANEIDFDAVIDGTTTTIDDIGDVLGQAQREHEAEDGLAHLAVVNVLETAEHPILVAFWDDTPETLDAFEAALLLEIPTHDITNGFDLVQFEDEPDAAEAQTSEPEPKPASSDKAPSSTAYTKDDLESFDFNDVKAIWTDEFGQEPFAPRTKAGTYVTAILAYQERQASADKETGEIVADADVDVVIPQEDDDRAPMPSPEDSMRSQLVGSCMGCGGPTFAIGEPPKVTWNHAPNCPLK